MRLSTAAALLALAALGCGKPAAPTPAILPTATEPAPKAEWTPSDRPARVSDVEVRVKGARVGPVRLAGDGEPFDLKLTGLLVTLEILNRSEARKIDYTTWRGPTGLLRLPVSTLRDDRGNKYKEAVDSSRLEGACENAASIYPGKSVVDVLAFEPPVDAAKHLDLEMPGKNVGVDGVFRFRIPISSVTR